jgi:hypothetical protein
MTLRFHPIIAYLGSSFSVTMLLITSALFAFYVLRRQGGGRLRTVHNSQGHCVAVNLGERLYPAPWRSLRHLTSMLSISFVW